GRTFAETNAIYPLFGTKENPNRFLNIIYYLGKIAIQEMVDDNKRVITFSPVLRERLGHHIHGEIWANNIKKEMHSKGLLERPIHIISANMHSVMNSLFATQALKNELKKASPLEVFVQLSKNENFALRAKVEKLAIECGMLFIEDISGTNIDVQIFDATQINCSHLITNAITGKPKEKSPVIIVMD